VDDGVLLIWNLGGRGAMVSAFAFELREGTDPVACSTLGWSAILWLTHIQRGGVCIGLGVQ